MDEAMLQISADLKPQRPAKKNKRYEIDPESGEKKRVIDSKRAQRN